MIRIFIGTESKTEIARKVLECSIVRRTEQKVEFVPMLGKDWEYPVAGLEGVLGTGFSPPPLDDPGRCNWRGRAVYLDADQLVFGDVTELWTSSPKKTPGPGRLAWMHLPARQVPSEPWPQSSVMVIDCAAAKGPVGLAPRTRPPGGRRQGRQDLRRPHARRVDGPAAAVDPDLLEPPERLRPGRPGTPGCCTTRRSPSSPGTSPTTRSTAPPVGGGAGGYAPEIYFPPVPVLPWTPAQIKIHRDADWRMAQITFVQCLKSLWRAARLTWKLWRRDYRPEPPLLPTR
jgi:hypothetical protein